MIETQQFIEANSIAIPWSGCWLWTRAIGGMGYGSFCRKGKFFSAHRTSWQVHNGPIPCGALVLHRCDVRCCVNPNHLFLGTHSDNTQDMISKGRHVSRRRASGLCKRGHQLTEKPASRGKGRYCKTCYVIQSKASKQRTSMKDGK